MDAELAAPDVAGEVVGWKALRITDGDLRSAHTRTKWPIGAPLVARCPKRYAIYDGVPVVPDTVVPHVDPGFAPGFASEHRCGVYAVDEPGRTVRYLANPDSVLARVCGYGKIVPGEHGWRSQYARIDALALAGHAKHHVIRAAAERYGVDVIEEDPLPAGWEDEGPQMIVVMTGTAAKAVMDLRAAMTLLGQAFIDGTGQLGKWADLTSRPTTRRRRPRPLPPLVAQARNRRDLDRAALDAAGRAARRRRG